jgi:BirA family transcriptional regulator, biotin operon repressor / biotin---[acetyl-CoA-carboxylase] ligase
LNKFNPKTLFIGKVSRYLPSCQSTNDLLLELSHKTHIPDGFVLYTGYQTAGRGQRGNQWESVKDQNCLMSLFLRVNQLPVTEQFYLSMAIALGVQKNIEDLCKDTVSIKWPNDILVQNKKIGGILIENSINGQHLAKSIVGIGINVNQTENLSEKATSLLQLGVETTIETFLEKLMEHLEKYIIELNNKNYSFLKNQYLSKLFRLNQTHSYSKNGQTFLAEITDVLPNGKLCMNTEVGLQEYDFKEISFIY